MAAATISKEILDDISVRFILNVREFVLLHPEEYFFILEEAHWFAIDLHGVVQQLPAFAAALLAHNGIAVDVEHDYAVFKAYKQSVRVYGTMIFDRGFNHCLLVQQTGSSTAVTFPKGKKSKNETGLECAIRETREEVGFDVSDKIVDIPVTIFEKITLYFVFNVDLHTEFRTSTRNEISRIFWFDLRRINSVRSKKNYKLFLVAYAQAARIIEELRNSSFHFDIPQIERAIEKAIPRQPDRPVSAGSTASPGRVH